MIRLVVAFCAGMVVGWWLLLRLFSEDDSIGTMAATSYGYFPEEALEDAADTDPYIRDLVAILEQQRWPE